MPYQPSEYVAPAFDQKKDNKYKRFVKELTGDPSNIDSSVFNSKMANFYSSLPQIPSSEPVNTLSDLLKSNFCGR